MELHGRLRLPGGVAAASGARATIRLVEVGRADAPAVPVAETSFLVEPGPGGEQAVAFDLETPDLDPRLTYAVQVHVDVNGSGEVSVGDYLTTQHVGVTAAEGSRVLDVPLERVG